MIRPPTSGRVAAATAAALLAAGGTALAVRPWEATALRSVAERPPALAPAAPAETRGAPTSGPLVVHVDTLAQPTPEGTAPAPTRFELARLGIAMPVVPVGVARDGAMGLPPTPATMGWYTYGPRPGDRSGATVLAGHLDLPGQGTGPLAALGEARPGDQVVVSSGDRRARYVVTDVSRVDKTRLDLPALFARDGPPRLHIVTCGGRFDPEERRYDQNVVVVAEPAR